MLPCALVLALFPFRGQAGEIWDPSCKHRSCSGNPIRADGVSNFDTWNQNKKYQATFYYNCTSGIGFDYTNNPTRLKAHCGKKCNEWIYKNNKGKTVKSGQCTSSTADDACGYNYPRYDGNPVWVYSWGGGSLPLCSKGWWIFKFKFKFKFSL